MHPRTLSLFIVIAALVLSAQPADAQIWKKAKDAAKRGAERAVERETARRADDAVTGMFEIADDAVRCAVTDETCVEQAEADGKQVVYVDDNGEPLPVEQQHASSGGTAASGSAAGGTASEQPGGEVWANYDFVPGERLLFASDFEGERVGNFPSRFEFVSGNAEIVEWGGKRYLRAMAPTVVRIPLPEELSEQFTVEFDYQQEAGYFMSTVLTEAWDLAPSGSGHPNHYTRSRILLGSETGLLHNDGPSSSTRTRRTTDMQTVRLQVDGKYGKLYLNEERVANLPNADLPRGRALTVMLMGKDNRPAYMGDIRVAAGGREMMYDRLMADGRFATQGVLFDTGSATIKPESTPTLKEIAQTLQQHADLRLRIEGHTDNTGSADANQQLSERRAAAVRDYLVQRESIDASRLESAGLGQTAPVADNSTPEGKQTNRRVELVVL